MTVLSAWRGRTAREQWLSGVAAAALLVLVVWSVGLAPALRTLSTAPSALLQFDAQLASMQIMAGEAARLQQRAAPVRVTDAVRLLEAATQQRLGPGAVFMVNADRVTVSVKAAQPDGLTQWLAQAREAAGAVTERAILRRTAAGWEGSITLHLPVAP